MTATSIKLLVLTICSGKNKLNTGANSTPDRIGTKIWKQHKAWLELCITQVDENLTRRYKRRAYDAGVNRRHRAHTSAWTEPAPGEFGQSGSIGSHRASQEMMTFILSRTRTGCALACGNRHAHIPEKTGEQLAAEAFRGSRLSRHVFFASLRQPDEAPDYAGTRAPTNRRTKLILHTADLSFPDLSIPKNRSR